MRTHYLANSEQYPLFYKYHASAAINIFSNVIVRKGDFIDINGEIFLLGTSKNINGMPKETENGSAYYYEFTLSKQN